LCISGIGLSSTTLEDVFLRFVAFIIIILQWKWNWLELELEFGVLLAANRQSTSSSGYRASLWDPWPHFILLLFFRLTNTWFFFLRRPLWRENGSVVYSAITHWSQ
jgi:hypothetical protein